MKITKAQSLRYQVEKWLAPTMPVRVTASGRTHSGRVRFVCIETQQATEPRALYFFQHDDGYWHVFPPAADDARQLHVHRKGTHGGGPKSQL
jgi:hypothetical protein